MKHLIDIDTWERKDNYLFFRDFHNSWIAMTGEVDCTEAYAEAKAQGDFDVILLSATPKLYFTSISYTQYAPGHPLDYPLMNAGKAVTREGRLVMPIALTVSHAFVDGAHISLFFEKVEKYLKER